MRKKTVNTIIAVVACAAVGVGGFALAGGFNPKSNTPTRDYTSTDDSGYTQKVEGVKYVMSSNVEDVTYDLADPLIINDTYYFTLEEPSDVPELDEESAESFKFSHFEYNYGEAELMSESPVKFRLKVAAKDVSYLKVVCVFKKVPKSVSDNTAQV